MCQKLCHPSKVWDAQYVYPAHGMHFNRSLATYMINAPDGNFPYSNDTLPDPGKQY